MIQKIRVGIIGTGFGANVHAPMFQHHPGFDLQAIASVSRGRTDEVREKTGIARVYEDWREMLAQEELDLVAVTSAPYLHHEMVLAAYERGLHVLCEKPMALDAEQTQAMIAARDAAGKQGFVNFEFRFRPARRKAKEIIESGQLGRLVHVRYETSFPSYLALTSKPRGWLGNEELGGGMLGALGSHMFDSLRWWTQEEVTRLQGLLPIHVPSYTDHTGNTELRTADDAFLAIGHLTGGTTFRVEFVSAIRHAQSGAKLEVFGTQGTLVMTDDRNVELSMGDDPFHEVELGLYTEAPKTMSAPADRYYTAFYPMIDAVHGALTTGERHPILPTFEDGHRAQLLLDAVRKSAKDGQRIFF
ncbi:MAG TPA: Gfo/Idh/MocA family oxidoreductase [Bacilli bacterium]|nr:Gfo/Idh/MocA family oxidoreductase [Bacilli bacterium]